MLEIVFIDRPGTPMRIVASTSVMDCLIDHVSETGLCDSGLELASPGSGTIRPMPGHNVLQRPTGQRDLISIVLDLTILSGLSNTQINGQKETDRNQQRRERTKTHSSPRSSAISRTGSSALK